MHQTWEQFKFWNNLLQLESAFSLEMLDVDELHFGCLSSAVRSFTKNL